MPYDANLVLQASVTKTATFDSTGVALRQPSDTTGTNEGGTPRRGLVARVNVTAVSGTSPLAIFTLQHSDDDSTWENLATELNGGGMSAAGTDYIPFNTTKPWVRLVTTITGTSPSFTYDAEIGEAFAG